MDGDLDRGGRWSSRGWAGTMEDAENEMKLTDEDAAKGGVATAWMLH
jgi:hypothetical protein